MTNEQTIKLHLEQPFSLMYLVNRTDNLRLHLTANGCNNPIVKTQLSKSNATLISTHYNRKQKGNNFIKTILSYVDEFSLTFETKI